ncbi:unnamed protein product [Ceutorhynchus assimilis]|uniref:BED-type domain-containing protein n=1 Tax=Ceutorhynchus assimilis TaxID=467358 RepID=A0A9N9QRD6_9CUCU|nr:unnamed protein product [Ceutorhynchus assimilis]
MAPLPDNDKTPDKKKEEDDVEDKPKESQKDEKTLSNLNDRELKALLDEAINYKNPKDREGKSELFNDLLLEAEETERIARATSAGGSELVRHCNPAARRQRHGGGPRGRRYGGPSSSGMMGRSVSERGTHGGSLDNLAKEELYDPTCRRLRGVRKSSTSSSGASSSYGGNPVRVSARQREGDKHPIWQHFYCQSKEKNTGKWAKCKTCGAEMQGIPQRLIKHNMTCNNDESQAQEIMDITEENDAAPAQPAQGTEGPTNLTRKEPTQKPKRKRVSESVENLQTSIDRPGTSSSSDVDLPLPLMPLNKKYKPSSSKLNIIKDNAVIATSPQYLKEIH